MTIEEFKAALEKCRHVYIFASHLANEYGEPQDSALFRISKKEAMAVIRSDFGAVKNYDLRIHAAVDHENDLRIG